MCALVLVIDPDPNFLQDVQDLLEFEDHEPWTANNGATAIQLVQTRLPDLIICNVMMLTTDSFSVITELRRLTSGFSIPYIFLASRRDLDNVIGGTEFGPNDMLIKPFEVQEFLNLIRQRLKSH